MLQRLPDIVHYWGYNLEGTPVIPKMYYDVYSEEQRWKEICCWLDKLTKYTDELAQLVNWIKNNYATKDELADEVLKLNNRITQEVKDLNDRITQEVATLNARIDTEVDTLNKRVDTEVDTLNKRVDTEVDTLNKRVDTEVDKLNKKDEYLENKIDNNFEILDTKIDDLETSQDQKRENLKNELNEKIDSNAETAKTYTDTEISKLKNSIDEQITNINTQITNINNTINNIIEKEKEDFNKLDQKLNEALKTSLTWNVTKGQVDSSIVTNRDMFNDLTDRSYRIQDMDNLTEVNVDELAESGLNTAGWAVCNSWLWDKSVKVYPQYMVDGVTPPTPPTPPTGEYTVSFICHIIDRPNLQIEPIPPQTVPANGRAIEPPAPIIINHPEAVFRNWCTEPQTLGVQSPTFDFYATPITENTVIYAHFDDNSIFPDEPNKDEVVVKIENLNDFATQNAYIINGSPFGSFSIKRNTSIDEAKMQGIIPEANYSIESAPAPIIADFVGYSLSPQVNNTPNDILQDIIRENITVFPQFNFMV